MRSRRALLLLLTVVLAGVLAAAGTAGSAQLQSARSAPQRVVQVYATYYGWYDNTPPGCATAYRPYCAGGRGTYDHPITFASYDKEFPVGTRLYYPAVEKYFVMGDECQECQADWTGHGPDGGPHLRHVDLWTGGRGGSEFAALNCENALTETTPAGQPLLTPFIEDPPSGLPVSKEPLFDPRNGHCYGGATAGMSRGRYENRASASCLTEATQSAGSLATVSPCSRTASEDVSLEGAFLMVHGLCLGLKGETGYGARLYWDRCDGHPTEQWEYGPSGEIAWVQRLRCVAVRRHQVVLARCRGGRSVRWAFHGE